MRSFSVRCHPPVLSFFTLGSYFPLDSVYDESVPGGAQHTTQLGDGKGIDVLAHCRRRGGVMTENNM